MSKNFKLSNWLYKNHHHKKRGGYLSVQLQQDMALYFLVISIVLFFLFSCYLPPGICDNDHHLKDFSVLRHSRERPEGSLVTTSRWRFFTSKQYLRTYGEGEICSVPKPQKTATCSAVSTSERTLTALRFTELT